MEKAETLSNAIVKAGETMEELREELKENERLQEAVHKNGLFKPEEFAEYNAYCESCKELVKNGGFLNGR